MNIRNIAIIAHVDHGKTTLVDAILKQSHVFRDNQKEMQQDLLMDSNDLEREKGITILAKNTSVHYKDEKINIIDTPGHADFGSEVERVLNMASGALLLVDAAEGPLPQTRFVLKKALEAKLKIILLINKIDKKDARPVEVRHEVESLFLELVEHEDALDFITLYGVDNDPYVGRICIGKVSRGTLAKGKRITLVDKEGQIGTYTVTKLFTSEGLKRVEVENIIAGDIVALAGIHELTIGQTVTDPQQPTFLPAIEVEEPTIKIKIGPNTSPFAGREGTFVTSRQIHARLYKELETDLGLRVADDQETTSFIVSGRGELHLAILIETMRREGYELEVSKPQVIYKKIDGKTCEPYEELTIDVHKDYMGVISDEIGKRKGKLINMHTVGDTGIRLVYNISSRNLIGIRSNLLTNTRGTAVMNTYLLGYEPEGTKMDSIRNGALIASQSGTTLSYGLANAQVRGTLFYGPGTK